MNFHGPKHPIWPLLKYIVMASTMIVMCSTLYKNGFDPKDLILIISTLASLAGVNFVEKKTTGE
jgi:hypothetical protein